MPRVKTYEGGNVQSQGITTARWRSADYGPSALGEGLQKIGQVASDAADRIDQIEDVKARVEANRLAVEHSEHVREINRRVRESLGEGAEAAADQGISDLEKATKELVGRASPRAQMLLQNELTVRSGTAIDNWQEHGFRQKGEALETSSVARIGRIVEDAADLEDEDQAVAMMGEIRGINEQRARFFGKGQDWLVEEDRKAVSGFYKSRAMKLAAGESGSASAAIGYAEQNREFLTDDDYLALVNGYNDSALEETAVSVVYGASPVGAAVEKGPEPEDGGAPKTALDPVAFFKAFVSPHEGSALVRDSNGALVRYGVNEEFHPGMATRMTEDKAAEIFKNKYFIPSGADKLPPGLAAIHSDTFWLNQKQAMKILKDSGGDPDKYIEMRTAFLNGLVQKNPGKYAKYKNGWERRTKELAAYADRQGGDGTPIPVTVLPTTNLETMRSAVMQRTDIGMNLKRRIIRVIEGRRAEVRQEQQIADEQTDDTLTTAVIGLGENFTDVKQLPQNVYLNAPPNIRQKYINMAKSNKETKPLNPEVAAQIGFLRTFRPQALAEPRTQRYLASKGVPAKTLSTLAEEGGNALGRVDTIERSALETLARPAFEAAGYRLWTLEQGDEKSKKKGLTAAEQKEDAARQIQLINYLETEAVAWASANPGKKADSKTMQQWVGAALIRTLHDKPFGIMTDAEVIQSYGAKNYSEVRAKLKANGIPEPTPADVAYYLRRHFQRTHGGR